MTMTHVASRSNHLGLAAAVAALVGVLLPWLDAPMLSRSGMSTSDGEIIAALAIASIIAGLVVVRPRRAGAVYLLCGGIGVATTVANLVRLGHAIRPAQLSRFISPGIGIYLDVAALTVLAIAGVLLIARRS